MVLIFLSRNSEFLSKDLTFFSTQKIPCIVSMSYFLFFIQDLIENTHKMTRK
jgi:hypothetical protein